MAVFTARRLLSPWKPTMNFVNCSSEGAEEVPVFRAERAVHFDVVVTMNCSYRPPLEFDRFE